ncbi:MAG: DUF4307 domain-containing protein [Microlunatus sp.]
MNQPRSGPAARPALSAADRERLARRYPKPRIPRPLSVAIVATIAVAGLIWLVLTALQHAAPVVSGQVPGYTVVSDTKITVTVTIDRSDPSIPVACRVSAKAVDFQPVGELIVPFEATDEKVVNQTVTITTVRRATTAVVNDCSPT